MYSQTDMTYPSMTYTFENSQLLSDQLRNPSRSGGWSIFFWTIFSKHNFDPACLEVKPQKIVTFLLEKYGENDDKLRNSVKFSGYAIFRQTHLLWMHGKWIAGIWHCFCAASKNETPETEPIFGRRQLLFSAWFNQDPGGPRGAHHNALPHWERISPSTCSVAHGKPMGRLLREWENVATRDRTEPTKSNGEMGWNGDIIWCDQIHWYSDRSVGFSCISVYSYGSKNWYSLNTKS